MFLPAISRLLSFVLLVLLAACGNGGPSAPTAIADLRGRIDVVAGSGEVDAADLERVRMAVDRVLPSLNSVFPGLPAQHFRLHVHARKESMPEALAAMMHEDSPGFALLGQHQIHIVWSEVRRTGSSIVGVVKHGLVHELLDQFAAPHGRLIPRWFHEGLAQLLAGDTYLGAREDDLLWRLGAGTLPAFASLAEHFPGTREGLQLAYAQSYSYVAWLHRQYGIDALLAVVAATDRQISFDGALVGRTHRTTLQLEDAWRSYLRAGSGAPWRVLFDQCFSLCLLAGLPVLVLALIRRLQAEARAGRRLAENEAAAARAAAARAAAEAAAAAASSSASSSSAAGAIAADAEADARDQQEGERGGSQRW